MIDILLIIYIALIISGIRSYRRSGDIEQPFLDITRVRSSRGALALLVLLGHISYVTDSGHIFPYMANTGFLAVSGFFFFTGFGVMAKHMSDPDYSRGFLKKRYPKLLVMYLIIFSIFFTVRCFALHEGITLKGAILQTFSNYPFVASSWYLFDTLIFYFVIWLMMCFLKDRYSSIVLYFTLFLFAFSVLLIVVGMGFWWFVSIFNIAVGMFFAYQYKKIVKFYDKYRYVLLLVYIALFAGFYSYYLRHTTGEAGSLFMLFVMISSSILFVLIYTMIAFLFKTDNKILDFIGVISLPFFLIQNMYNEVLPVRGILGNDLLFACFSIVCTMISAYILNMVLMYIFKFFSVSSRK